MAFPRLAVECKGLTQIISGENGSQDIPISRQEKFHLRVRCPWVGSACAGSQLPTVQVVGQMSLSLMNVLIPPAAGTPHNC